MKKREIILSVIFILSLILLGSQFYLRYKKKQAVENMCFNINSTDSWYSDLTYIEHAGGSIDNWDYTNSLEVVERSLSRGARCIEIDFSYTSDNQIVCYHLWDNYGVYSSECPTYDEFMNTPIWGRFTPLDASMIIDYMREYPDLYIMTDAKDDDVVGLIGDLVELVNYDSNILDRLIIQVYHSGEKEKINAIYQFPDDNFVLTTYRFSTQLEDILYACYTDNIHIVTLHYDNLSPDIIQEYTDRNIVVLVYTVNNPNVEEHLFNWGVNSIYTDYLSHYEQ